MAAPHCEASDRCRLPWQTIAACLNRIPRRTFTATCASLVIVDARGGPTRYRLLDTIREYALEQLAASGKLETAQRDHATYFLSLAEHCEPELTGPQEAASLEQLPQPALPPPAGRAPATSGADAVAATSSR